MDQQIANQNDLTFSSFSNISNLEEQNQISQGGLLSNELSLRPSITFLINKNSMSYSDYYLETHSYDDVNNCEFSRIVIQNSESDSSNYRRINVLTRLLFYESSNIKKFSLFIIDNTVDINVIDINTTSSFDGKIIFLTSFSDNLIKLRKKIYLVNNNFDIFPLDFVERYIILNEITNQNKKLLLVIQKHDNNKKIKVIGSYNVQNDFLDYNIIKQLFFQPFEKNFCIDVMLHKGQNIIKLPNNVPVKSFFIISSRECNITVQVNASWKNISKSLSSVTFNKYIDTVNGLYDLQYLSILENNVFVFDPFCSLNESQVRMSINLLTIQILGHCMFSDDSLIEINSDDNIQIQICYNTINAMIYNLKDYETTHNNNYWENYKLNGCNKFIQTSSYFDENINNKVDSFIEQFNLLDDKSHLKEVVRYFKNIKYLKLEDYLKMFPDLHIVDQINDSLEEQYTRFDTVPAPDNISDSTFIFPISRQEYPQNFPDNASDSTSIVPISRQESPQNFPNNASNASNASDNITDVLSYSNQVKYINQKKLSFLMCEIYYNRNIIKQLVNKMEKFLYATPKKLAKDTICNISFEPIKNKEYYYECSKCLKPFCSTEYKKWCHIKFIKDLEVSCPMCRSSDIGMNNLYLNKHPINYKEIGLTAICVASLYYWGSNFGRGIKK
jgi:hypothetical protein